MVSSSAASRSPPHRLYGNTLLSDCSVPTRVQHEPALTKARPPTAGHSPCFSLCTVSASESRACPCRLRSHLCLFSGCSSVGGHLRHRAGHTRGSTFSHTVLLILHCPSPCLVNRDAASRTRKSSVRGAGSTWLPAPQSSLHHTGKSLFC